VTVGCKEEMMAGGTVVRARRLRVNYLDQDWPDSMAMDEKMFARYAEQLEKADFEDDVRGLSSSIRQLVEARQETITRLRASAEYLDSIWMRCRVTKTMGTSTSILGGGLTIAGGILTTLTAGAAAPVLIAGLATSSVGAATNIGTSMIEKVLNSRQIKEMNAAFERDKDITLKLEAQIEDVRRFKDSSHLTILVLTMQSLLGPDHLLVVLLRGVLLQNLKGAAGMSSDLMAQGAGLASAALQSSAVGSVGSAALGLTSQTLRESAASVTAETGTMVVASSVKTEAALAGTLLEKGTSGIRYSALDAGALVEGGKVIGQNSFKVAGQVIIGISAAFLVWDAIDLGFTINDLVRKQGSKAARVLREKAATLEGALDETLASYSVQLPD